MAVIQKLINSCLSEDIDTINKLLNSISINLDTIESKIEGKTLVKNVLQKWLNFGDCMIQLIINHLPSPTQA